VRGRVEKIFAVDGKVRSSTASAVYVGTEFDTGSYKIFKVMAPTFGGEPNKKFKRMALGDGNRILYFPIPHDTNVVLSP
jgi:hypothetical protein